MAGCALGAVGGMVLSGILSLFYAPIEVDQVTCWFVMLFGQLIGFWPGVFWGAIYGSAAGGAIALILAHRKARAEIVPAQTGDGSAAADRRRRMLWLAVGIPCVTIAAAMLFLATVGVQLCGILPELWGSPPAQPASVRQKTQPAPSAPRSVPPGAG